MFKKLKINDWYRKDAFHFFKDYEDPFFNITSTVKVTDRYIHCKANEESFFLHTIHAALISVNTIREFKMRLLQNELVIFDVIHGGSTILNEDHSFSFCYFDYEINLIDFIKKAKQKIDNTRLKKGMNPKTNELGMIHFSSIPWVSFTSFKHARKKSLEDTIPKIVFGKYYYRNQNWHLPVSVEVHHSMMDGYHIGIFFESFEKEMMKIIS